MNTKAEQHAEPTGDRDPLEFDAVELEAAVGLHVGTDERDLMAFRLTSKVDEGSETGKSYAASIPDRAITWTGTTAGRTVASMLHGVAMLARDGSIDPSDPKRKGVPPIQHVLNILSERLAWHVARRCESCDDMYEPRDKRQDAQGNDETLRWQARCNEVIAALGTAVSALARIKDL